MATINDSLSPDLIFNIFKSLDSIEVVVVRRVCRQWHEIIEEHKSFWRLLYIPESTVRFKPSTLDLFDQKSHSTLVHVDIRRPVDFDQDFLSTLARSKDTLRHLSVRYDRLRNHKFLETFSRLKFLTLINHLSTPLVRLKTTTGVDLQDRLDDARPLKVLWNDRYEMFYQIKDIHFHNLVSLDLIDDLSAPEWRNFLEVPSKSLKYLKVGFKGRERESHEGIERLDFPNLQVLHLQHGGGAFPQWMIIPSSVKLILVHSMTNLPSISELWIFFLFGKMHFTDRCPNLNSLLLLYFDMNGLALLLDVLEKRKISVEAGLEVDGVKMEMIKTLIVPTDFLEGIGSQESSQEKLGRLRELIVVEGNSESRFIEVEI